MKRASSALVIGFAWLFTSIFLVHLRFSADPDLLNSWQASRIFWPGNTVAILVGGGGMLGLYTANFLVAALSNLLLYSGIAYLFLSFVSLAKQKLGRRES